MTWLQSVIVNLQNEHILYVGASDKRANDCRYMLSVPDKAGIMNYINLKLVNLGKGRARRPVQTISVPWL